MLLGTPDERVDVVREIGTAPGTQNRIQLDRNDDAYILIESSKPDLSIC